MQRMNNDRDDDKKQNSLQSKAQAKLVDSHDVRAGRIRGWKEEKG